MLKDKYHEYGDMGSGYRSDPYTKAFLKKNGESYSSLVIGAYKKGKISHATAADYIGFKTKHMSAFEKLVKPYAG